MKHHGLVAGSSETLGNMYLNDMETASGSSSCRLGNAWKGAELMSLLRKATKGRRPGSLFLNPEAELEHHRCDSIDRDHLECHLHHHRYRDEDDDDWDRLSHKDFEREREGLELLLKKTEAQMSQMEQDRSRLLPVAEKLVDLGAGIGARDNEGRTALHLAAGCGDMLMVHKLVELGADVNSKDSVGGTAMHHAAMANKKEMMYTLATLGCDWRAKAAGIDGASPAFVLCGQHGKTTRQQRLLEARLKQKYQDGEAARKSERECFDEAWDRETEHDDDYEEKLERADANMAALLEEEAAEAAAAENKKFSSRKKNKRQTERSTDADAANRKTSHPAVSKKAETQDRDSNRAPSEGARNALKNGLDEAVNCANFVLEIGSIAGHDAIMDVKEKMDRAISSAQQGNVGAKYAKKVRKKLQSLIDALPDDTLKTSLSDAWSNNMGDSSKKQSNDDNEGWMPAQSGNRRKQSALRMNSHQGESTRKDSSAGWQQVGQKIQRTMTKTGHQQSTRSNATNKTKVTGVCSQLQLEETQKMVLASIPKPSEKALMQHRIEAEKGVQRSNSATVRLPNTDSNSGKNVNSVWEQTQKPSTTSNLVPLSGPDFPPLQPSLSATAPTSQSIGRSPSKKTESDKRSVSQDSVDMAQKAEVESVESAVMHMQSSSSASSATVSVLEQSGEAFPQYELFGTSTSPAFSAALSGHNHSEVVNSIKVASSFVMSDVYAPAPNAVANPEAVELPGQPFDVSGGQGVYSMHQTENTRFPLRCSGPPVPVMIMSGTHSAVTSHGSITMPVTHAMYPVVPPTMSYDAMSPYVMYSCPPGAAPMYMPMHAVPAQHPTGHSPTEPVALQVAMECLNSDEIADRLPKDIPGLVDSDQEELLVPHRSYGQLPIGSPMDSSGVLPRHLLGELASELEA